jgi:hypothetical protein
LPLCFLKVFVLQNSTTWKRLKWWKNLPVFSRVRKKILKGERRIENLRCNKMCTHVGKCKNDTLFNDTCWNYSRNQGRG